MFKLLGILLIINYLIIVGNSFDVHFHLSYPSQRLGSDLDTDLYKRAAISADYQQFFDKASYTFNGLNRVASVPVAFPLDICILQLPTVKYATALHKNEAGLRQFAVFEWKPNANSYELLLELPTPKAVALDCLAYGGRGYVALSFNHTETIKKAREGSPIYELSPEAGIRVVQYFASLHLRGMYLRISSQELTLLQTIDTDSVGDAKQQRCPYFKWTAGTFQRLGSIACSNARRLEAFGIDFNDYVAVANYASSNGRTATNSEIYRYNSTIRRFQLFQRLRSNGAVDVKYFSLPVNEVDRRHFLILGNTVAVNGSDSEADTVIYMYDKGQFVPYQRLSFYALERVLPVQHAISEKFLLLVACHKQDVKIYNLNDWKFEESSVQFTEGAFSRGVARMRNYDENDQQFLVIANENMAANETNIYEPLYKQDEHANVLRQQIIEWARQQKQRLQQQNIENLIKGLEQKLKTREDQLHKSHIKRIRTKTYTDERLQLSSNYWEALEYAKRALDVVEKDAQNHHLNKRDASKSKRVREEHQFAELTVNTLVIHDKLHAKRINGLNVEKPIFNWVNASQVNVSENYKEPSVNLIEKLQVKDLQLKGKLNGHNWMHLLEQTLKRKSMKPEEQEQEQVQFIKSSIDVKHLKTKTVLVNSHEINDRSLNHLVSIDGGNYIVQQDVQFAQPIQVNRLLINQRLNHIHVDRQRFDLLLKEANYTQVIEGAKRFERVQVQEPITIAGQLLGPELRAMSPMKVTHQSLVLQGDYTINNQVIIGKQMVMKDLIDSATQHSVKELLNKALPLNKPLKNITIRFEQPLKANQTNLSFLNNQDLQQLIQLNVPDVQMVEATKFFPHKLEISQGYAEVKYLNGHDIQKLSQSLLTKSGNQTIEWPIDMESLQTTQVQAKNLQLNGLNPNDYLQLSKNQISNATLHLNHLTANKMNIENLHLNGQRIFNQSLTDIYTTGSKAPWDRENFNGTTIYAQNLWLKGHINHQWDVAQIEQRLQQLAGNIKYVGDFTFQEPINITHLRFGQTLNGLTSREFGYNWLTMRGEQNFTAPQSLAAMESPEGVGVYGKVNNYTLDQLVQGSYRLNASELLPTVRFENPIVMEANVQVGSLNGLHVPEDLLYKSGGGYLLQPVNIQGNLAISKLCNISLLNGYPLEKVADYLQEDSLIVEQAEFDEEPTYQSLNGHHMDDLLNRVWLDNEPIELSQPEINSASFEGLINFQGDLNGHKLDQIGHRYFSLTRDHQQVNIPVQFNNDVTFAEPPTARLAQLRGSISNNNNTNKNNGHEAENNSLNFDDFVANTLKTSGLHTISGQWKASRAIVQGNLKNVLINQLNLVDDIVCLPNENDTNPSMTTIEALKIVPSSTVKRLYATSNSRISKIPIANWINNAVYIYGNHSIAGKSQLDAVSLYNDLRVDGLVNGIPWTSDHLLLRDREQYSDGSLRVDNILPQEKRILTHNIEELWVDHINSLNVNQLLVNKARNRPNLHVKSELIFKQPLSVGNYEIGTITNQEEEDDQPKTNGNAYKWKRATDDWSEIQANVAAVQQRLNDPPKVLENFIMLQKLVQNFTHLETFIKEDQDMLALRKGIEQTDYFIWQRKEQNFKHNSSLPFASPAAFRLEYKDSSIKEFPLILGNLKCLAQQLPDKLNINCRNKTNNSSIPRSKVKQLLPAASSYNDSALLLLTHNQTVEIWQWKQEHFELHYSLEDQQVEHVANHNDEYVALLLLRPTPEIRIYRLNRLEQIIDLNSAAGKPYDMIFWYLNETEDILLCLTSHEQGLTIYQHQGAAGFKLILKKSTLPLNHTMILLELGMSKLSLLGLTSGQDLYLIAPQFAQL
ncbi:uncharacterized protein clos [Drosophila tropicalis]|uniref:uncharacterized protein clos n=1 Tax=Drosophila tropicalis TaxID=46794 RepID=UPI0035AB70BC